MQGQPRRDVRRHLLAPILVALLVGAAAPGASAREPGTGVAKPRFSDNVAFDVSPPLSVLAKRAEAPGQALLRPERGAPGAGEARTSRQGDDALQSDVTVSTIPGTLANFEGLSNQDNFNVFGFRVNPPDPVGDVGPNHYVEMVNLVFAIYSKSGTRLIGPVDTGTLWADFPVEDCTDASGDPIVVYDQFVDRWILSQFTTRPLFFPPTDPRAFDPFYNCVAVSTSGDPTGTYYRYAFITQPDEEDGGYFFPDYPKYGVWTDSYTLTTRDFGFEDEYGISVYALEKNKMVNGHPPVRSSSSSTRETCRLPSSATACCPLTSTASRSPRPTPRYR
jgi:hypothetical protein